MNKEQRIVLTGFMGVGKSSVARHVAHLIKSKRVDLDHELEYGERRTVAQIIDAEGEPAFRDIESRYLQEALDRPDLRVLSLGGGTWTLERNREIIKRSGLTSVWLESTFEHCWLNVAFSRKDRPLARDKKRAFELFQQRQQHYALADWHFVVRPDSTSFDVAKQIIEQIFS
ncbi:MAG TPA: shikimate kinase [Pyrinomonadaceae bacterium]|nr:shikimate kinase [Chloracidobacterium sp.]MBP9935192.1 hypothetical protein [Pyrinomonadaceae bacterium]MBK7803046.1 shikimate kinase [Chloracidobacterium sp.]MBK9438303.1 shikimate kinase [Chloracidobacterium sp.]MBL0240811.1 shikimate kinase [Chloracidobacterium sp.]